MGKQFRVDTDALEAVAKRVKALLDDVSGANGYQAGSKPELDKIGPDAISTALGAHTAHPMDGTGNGGSAFAESYRQEHEGLKFTYQSMITQLQNLYTTCHTTAQTYANREDDAKKAVTNPGTHGEY
ncbi:WXG100 family type VII secretion target [Jatrophihabitans fulvus]